MKKLIAFITCAAVFFAMSVTAFADMGPKPSIKISFSGADESPFFSTMLVKTEGNFIAPCYEAFDDSYDSEEFQELSPEKQDAVRKFAEYPAPDGYKFFGSRRVWDSGSDISWGYMPPDIFVLLVYFPDSGVIAESPELHTYAFNSYYTADLSTIHDGKLSVKTDYQPGKEILKFLVRVLITVAVEIIVALLFGYWEKRTLLFFAVVNCATQILLNIILSLASIQYDIMLFMTLYFFGELLVMTGEAIFYGIKIRKYSRHQSPVRAAFYALAANAASFIAGIFIAFFQITILL